MVDTAKKARLTLGLLLLIPAGLVAVFLSGVLVMGSAGCGSSGSAMICSATVQMWVMVLPPAGAVTGMVVGAILGTRSLRQSRPITNAVLAGWLVFAVAEASAIVLGTA